MSAPDFLDTNVLVYAYDPRDRRKQEIAQNLIRGGLTGLGVVSTQVLAEFAVTQLHKASPPASPVIVQRILETLSPLRLIVPDRQLVSRATDARTAYGLHFYDGMIVAAAERGRCTRIFSEDLNPGQRYFDIPVENPFAP